MKIFVYTTVQAVADGSDEKREQEREREMGLGLGNLDDPAPRQPNRGVSSDPSESNSLGLQGVEIPSSMAPDCDPEAMVQDHDQ